MRQRSTSSSVHAEAKVTPSAYRNALDAAQLINLRLTKSEFSVEPEGLGRDRSQWKSSYDFQVRDVAFDPTRKLLTALVGGEASCKVGRKKILLLRCRYIVAYQVSGAPDEAAAMLFARRVAAFAAYPFFRSHFAESCSQAGVELPPLPIMKEPARRIAASSD